MEAMDAALPVVPAPAPAHGGGDPVSHGLEVVINVELEDQIGSHNVPKFDAESNSLAAEMHPSKTPNLFNGADESVETQICSSEAGGCQLEDDTTGCRETIETKQAKAHPQECLGSGDAVNGKEATSSCVDAEKKRSRDSQSTDFVSAPAIAQVEISRQVKPKLDELLPAGGLHDDHSADGSQILPPAETAESCMNDGVNSNDNTAENDGAGILRARPKKRRKIAMLLAYCGAGYQGMQKNPGAITIEGELEEALLKSKALPDNYDGNPRKVDWMRAARTDKGVSAVGQVVSGLFFVDPPGFVERVNTHLPKQIRLLGYKRVTPTFSAKKFCDRRRYEYLIPTFALDPSAHRDRESVLASEGKDGAFIKCQECSERGRKIPGAVGKGYDRSTSGGKEENATENEKEIQKPGNDEEITSVVNKANLELSETLTNSNVDGELGNGPSESSRIGAAADIASDEVVLPVPDARETQEVDGIFSEKQNSRFPDRVEESGFLPPPEHNTVSESQGKDKMELNAENIHLPFHFGEAERTRLNKILNQYVGTHNFHNFTTRVKSEDPSAKRYIVSFEAVDVFTVGNTEFVKCVVIGQSFMLHQIRKMIGLAIAIFRGCTPASMLDTALRRDVHVTVPTAPELGLFLDECMYPAYNQKWYNTHEEVSQKGFEEEINRFKHDIIYEHIATSEHKEGLMALFLHSLNDRNYPDFVTAREAEKLTANQQA